MNHSRAHLLRCLAVACAALAPWLTQAACSKAINAPLAPSGQGVTIDGANINGIYPEILRTNQSKDTCMFALSAVPRARLELLFESGVADIMIPASKTARRDELGIFVPLSYNRPVLISLQSERPTFKSLKELLDQKDLKVALVRGYDYGPVYQETVAELSRQGRLQWEADPLSVARLLKSGSVHAALMAPTILVGTINDEERVRDLADKLRFESFEELPWTSNGVYIAKGLPEGDRQALLEFFDRVAKSGAVWQGFQQYYAAPVLKAGLKPR